MSDESARSARVLMPRGAEGFGRRVHAVSADSWDAPTPDDQWTVRNLVAHLVTEHLWVPALLGGESVAKVGDRFAGDVLGDDPVAAWDSAIAASLAAWDRAADDAAVDLSSGPSDVRAYAEEMLNDLTVHAWDLARGAGLDERLDPALVAHVLAYVEPRIEGWRTAGLFGPRVPVGSDDPQDQLLGLVGRQP